jgi:hypothetical protein
MLIFSGKEVIPMKKFFAGMMTAMLLVAVMGTTVFAATSPDAETALKKQEEDKKQAAALNTSITKIDAAVGKTSIVITQSALDVKEMEQGKDAVTEKKYSGETSVLAMTDLTVANANGTDITQGVTVSLTVPGVLSGDNIHVLHQTGSGSWEELSVTSVGKDSVTVTMTSFSPIVVVRVAGTTTTSTPTYVYYTTPSSSSTTAGATTDSNTTDGDTDAAASGSTKDVSLGTTDVGTYTQGYSDGYAAGAASVKGASTTDSAKTDSTKTDAAKTDSAAAGTNAVGTTVIRTVGSTSGSNLSATSPKTGASLPALPVLAVFAFAGILVCGKKAQNR